MAYVAINGCILEEEEASLSPLDRGFLYGDGLFETIKVRKGCPYFLDRHLARMKEGASLLGIPFPENQDLPGLIREVLRYNQIHGEGAVKICLSRGRHEGDLCLYRPNRPTVVVLARPYREPTPAEWERGISLAVEREILQNPWSGLCGLKSLNYLLYLLVRTRARHTGCDEAILMNPEGHICECTTSNLFLFRAGRWETPACSCGLLPGILRAALIECMAEAGQPVQEVAVTEEELKSAEEIFVTNSLVEVLPVARVDQTPFPSRERTRQVRDRFRAFRDAVHGCGQTPLV